MILSAQLINNLNLWLVGLAIAIINILSALELLTTGLIVALIIEFLSFYQLVLQSYVVSTDCILVFRCPIEKVGSCCCLNKVVS